MIYRNFGITNRMIITKQNYRIGYIKGKKTHKKAQYIHYQKYDYDKYVSPSPKPKSRSKWISDNAWWYVIKKKLSFLVPICMSYSSTFLLCCNISCRKHGWDVFVSKDFSFGASCYRYIPKEKMMP